MTDFTSRMLFQVSKLTRKAFRIWNPIDVTTLTGEVGRALQGLPGETGDGKLWFVVGKDGHNIAYERLEKMPHLLVAGTTGSGKSVFLNGLLVSLLSRHSPNELKLGIVDPKHIEFRVYNKMPHMERPVAVELSEAVDLMKWAVGEMQDRLFLFTELIDSGKTIKSLDDYNSQAKVKLPRIVLIIDEFADLVMSSKGEGKEAKAERAEFETLITRVAQKARATGIHLVLATQKPITTVVTTLLKGNIPARAAFRVTTSKESEVILDESGLANTLKGMGDMYFRDGTGAMTHLQGIFFDDVIHSVVEGC